MPRAYSYIRFSTPEQAKGDSLRRQVESARAWCEAHGMILDESLRDLGVSAYRGANQTSGSLRRFLDLVEDGQVERGSYLIVESLDRLSRETVLDAAARLLDLVRAGITVVTLADSQVYSEGRLRADWSPLIMSITIMARAHEESRLKGERVGAAWRRKREDARKERRPLTHRCPGWLRLVDGRFESIPDRVKLVRRIYQMTIEGYGQRSIVKALNDEGLPAFRTGNGWQTSSVRRVLTSRTVLGEYQPHTGTHRAGNWKPEGEPIQGFYPAIIDEATFWRAQQAMEGRRASDGTRGQGGRRGRGVAHLLMGLGKCTRCRGSMHIINKGPLPKGGVYFECSTARRKLGCENDQRWRVEQIERRVLRGLSYLDVQGILTGKSPSSDNDPVAVLRIRLVDSEKRRDRLLALAESGDDAAGARFATVAAEVKTIRSELAQAEANLAKTAADPGLKTRLAETVDLSRLMEVADGENRTAIRMRLAEQLRKLVKEVLFDPELGALAILTPQPGVAPEDIPWIVGQTKAQAWRISLDFDGDPHGLDEFDYEADERTGTTSVFKFKTRAQ